ncbi:ribosome-inactivating family protein [Kitasatospora sp. NPDC101176]|uniref:ribosome-inactivating family protein n=1 Tax=Kitasatospora sp. NPDC101176 TaxID=3364099 RepID=UPI0037F2FEF1
MHFAPSRHPASGRNLRTRITALLVAFVAGVVTLVSGAGAAHANTGDYRVAHCWVTMTGEWQNPGQMSKDWGTFLQSLRQASGSRWNGETYITQGSNSVSLIRADLNAVNGGGRQMTLRLWFTPDNLYLRGFTTTPVDARPGDGDITYAFNDEGFNLGRTMDALRNGPDGGLIPPATYRSLSYDGSYPQMERPQRQGGPGVSRDDTGMSYSSLMNSVFQLAYLARGTEQNGGNQFQATARSLLRMIQVTSEAARLRDVQGIVIQMMANHGMAYTMPARQQELENGWSRLSRYAAAGQNGAGIDLGPHVPHVENVARALAYLALALAPTVKGR